VVAASIAHGVTINIDMHGSSGTPPTGAMGPGGDGVWNVWAAATSSSLGSLKDSDFGEPPSGDMYNLYVNSLRISESSNYNYQKVTFTFSGLTENGEYDLYLYNGRPDIAARFVCNSFTNDVTGDFTDGTYDVDSDYVIFSGVPSSADGELSFVFADIGTDPGLAGIQLVDTTPPPGTLITVR